MPLDDQAVWQPGAKVVLQSDNASCLSSQDHIALVYAMNERNATKFKGSAQIVRWIYTEAQTGKTFLDTHFSYINKKMIAFVQDGNDMVSPEGIYEALIHNGGIAGSTAVLADLENLPAGEILQKKVPVYTGCRATHDINGNHHLTLFVE